MFDYRFIDTNAFPLEEDPRHPGKKTQILLSPAEMQGGVVRISYWPPGFTENIRRLIAHGGHRHYHRSVNERHYVLAGDWTSLYWSANGEVQHRRLHRHHYLENPPMALHGISRDHPPEAGTKFLVWTSGAGTDIYEPAAKVESVDVDFEGDIPAGLDNSPIVFNAEDREWQPHPTQPSWLVKPLSGSVSGQPEASLVNVPPASGGRVHGQTSKGAGKHWLFVVSGDLALNVRGARGATRVGLKEGGFLAWGEEATVESEGTTLSCGGCVAICVGHQLGPE
jgi:hypothetical protein